MPTRSLPAPERSNSGHSMLAEPSGLSYRRRMGVLAICCMSLLIVGVDTTAVNIALPSIQRGLHAGLDQLQWVVDAYTVTLASLLMLSGSTADRLGRRQTFQLGLAIFAMASVGCALAPTSTWLIIMRAAQGIGASMLNPVAMAIIRAVFTSDSERARALGVWAAVFGVAMAIGPLVGGLLLGAGWGWRAIFWINVPLAASALALTARFVPAYRAEPRRAQRRRLDPLGQVLVIVTLAAATFGIIDGPRFGWGSLPILGCFLLSAAGVAGLVIYEPRRREPLLDPRLFRSGPFSAAALICCLGFAAFGGFLWLTTLYLQNARGFSSLQAGLLTTPMAAMTVLFGPVSGRLVARHGRRSPLLISGVCMATAALMLTGLTATTPLGWLIASYTVFGVGFAMISAPTNNAALTAMPATRAGTAAAITSTSRQMGQVLGVAIAGSVLASDLAHPRLGAGFGAEFAAATSHVWWTITGYSVLIIPLGLTTDSWTGRASAKTAARGRHARRPRLEHHPHVQISTTTSNDSSRRPVTQRRGRHRAHPVPRWPDR